jgi:predicted permease
MLMLHDRGFSAVYTEYLFVVDVAASKSISNDPCPNVAQSLGDVWMLLLWPAYVVFCGLVVGFAAAKISGTPRSQIRSVLAACAFSNSTGLPITLLAVVHANFPATTELGRIDPTLFLSVYLLTYPMLQWSIGGWLLAPEEIDDENEFHGHDEMVPIVDHHGSPKRHTTLGRNVLNNKDMETWYQSSRRGMGETDASLYISEADLVSFEEAQAAIEENREPSQTLPTDFEIPPPPVPSELSRLLSSDIRESSRSLKYESDSSWATIKKILSRVFQPPVVGAMAGIIIAATPLRGIFVDLVDRNDSAPLEWMFDGLYAVGLSAVPLNMMILGVNLSQSHLSSGLKSGLMSSTTMAAIVVGKLIVLPIVGVVSALICKKYLWNIPDDIDAAFYLVIMIAFLTPTANNVMVMVELSGGAKEGIARAIAWQYAASPIFLSLSMTIAVGVASQWS